MSAKFRVQPVPGPPHMAMEPQKAQPPEKFLHAGLEHRPFTDEEIKQAFDTFDLDRNRFVGAAEIHHILQVIGEEVTDEEIDEMIRICDTDGDGQVTFDEFYKMMTEPEPPKPPVQQPQQTKRRGAGKKYQQSKTHHDLAAALEDEAASLNEGPQRKQKVGQAEKVAAEKAARFRAVGVETLVRKLSGGMGKIKPSQIKKVYKRFQEIDLDKSGAIDYPEFVLALDMEDGTVARQLFRIFDMDGSGKVELKEFIVMLARYTTAAKTEKLKFAFMMFDEDGSGFIERDELIEMLRASFVVEGFSTGELEERADQVFELLHLPSDGAISYENFLQLSKLQSGLIYPIEEERRHLGKDLSINQLLSEAADD